jgi:signal transduction histidine kinase
MFRMTQKIQFPPTVRVFARFAIAGLLGFVVIAALLFHAWMTAFERHLIKESQTNTAKYVNAMISHMLTRKDFETVKAGDDWDIFRRKVANLFSLREVIRVKLYNPQGDLIWSDKRELLELSPPAARNPELLAALAGHIEAKISSLDKDEHRFERESFRTLMELYVPIYLDSADRVAGVAEIYLNVDPLYSTLRDTRWVVGFTIVGGLGLLLLISFVGLGRAVALIHKQNDELRRALADLLNANRLRRNLLTYLSHELRNPDAVMSYAGLLQDGVFADLPAACKPPLENMRNTAAEILSHFTRILELTRLKAGDVIAQKETVNLNALLSDVTADLRLLCGDTAVALRAEMPPDNIVIHSDRDLLQQVLMDLVTNAIKCTVKGQITVRLEPDSGDRVKITVEDTGIGIKPEVLPKIFNEFYRGNDPQLRYKSGVGLGLPIAKKCVELLKGEIQVESVYGRGAKFTVTLPRDLPGSPAVLQAA